jgi:hypothetical protein
MSTCRLAGNGAQYYALNEPQCSDDWCIAAVRTDQLASNGTNTIRVAYALSSRAGRIWQRELHVASYLVDDKGRRYDPIHGTDDGPFDTLLGPSQSIPATRRFAVPSDANVVGVVVTRDGAGRFPACCIIGDNGSFLHRPAMVRFDGR